MHEIEPYYRWRDDYIASEDERSPFYGVEYSEFEFDKQIYNFLLHPQWDQFGSLTLYIKILYADYERGFAIMELIGEWNDEIYNDIILLKREIIDIMTSEGINKILIICENLINLQDIDDGWIVAMNFRDHVIQEFQAQGIDYYIHFGGDFNTFPWRTLKPKQLYHHIQQRINKRLGM